ncbi:ABC transporter substrate-binding protein [Kibdelosporangium philippinense]|uniref:ABC transporter substrate-binding protein n=2 Tax=Kibdelosporangium philippinense TaxID=211113 RepID=A0ABS8ZN07_9PSEU|nr:ABC transporter substrate-binding protein [Kibdelosporangium philippinense]MCE7009095.1 ABC transporter substrate-binding protein [Kibdelosporangium philippinense]
MSIIGVVVLTLSGCGLLGDSDNSGTAGATVVKVSVMPTTDLAPFHLAMRSGYFEAEGLKIESTTAPSGPASVAKMVSGEVDIAYGSYTPFFTAKAQNTADIKIIAACSSAGPSSTMVVTMPDSSVKSVKDLPGKRVAVTARGTMSDLLTMSAVKSAGVDYQSIQWVTMPFPDTPARLQRGDVDAAFLTEPFVTQAIKTVGAVPLFDTATGPTAGMPTAGYGATAAYVASHGAAIQAFRRVMDRATTEAVADRAKIEPLLVEYAKVTPEIAKSTRLLTFESKVDVKSIQRVPDLMREFGFIDKQVDVASMI